MLMRVLGMVVMSMVCLSGCAVEVDLTDSGTGNVRVSVDPVVVSNALPGTVNVGSQQGMKAPDFVGSDLDGGTFALREVGGKAAAVCFWTLGSQASERELEKLQDLHRSLGDDLTVVGVNVGDSADQVRAFVSQKGYDWLFVLDSQGRGRSRFTVNEFPTTVFLDKRRMVIATMRGEVGLEELDRLARVAIGK